MNFFDGFLSFLIDLGWPQWLSAAAMALMSLVVTLVLKHLLIRQLVGASTHTHLYYDTLVLRSLSRPLGMLLLGGHLWVYERLCNHLGLSSDILGHWANIAVQVSLILGLMLFIDRVVRGTIEHYALHSVVVRNSQGVMSGLVRGLVFGIGVLVLLSSLGVSVTPVLASLGVTSLAVALALQPTLENLFSGIQLLADKPFQVGDFIALESGEQGFIERIGWRSTWVRMLANNLVVIPNSKISQSRIINYNYPSPEMSVPVEVSVHYNSDLVFVQKIAKEVAVQILKTVPGAQAEFEPKVNFHTFGDSGVGFTVVLRATEFAEHFVLKSEFIKALHRRFQQEGICIPFPIVALNTDQENPLFRQAGPDANKR